MRPDRRTLLRSAIVLAGVAALLVLPRLIYPVLALEILLWGLFAMSVDLLLGFAGLLSFGHAAFWGIGGYAAALLARAGARSSFLGYYGYPATICTSVNEQIVHGIPGKRKLKDGDIIGIDAGAIVDGWHADAAVTHQATHIAAKRTPATGATTITTNNPDMWRA